MDNKRKRLKPRDRFWTRFNSALKPFMNNLKESLIKIKRKLKKTYRKYKYMDKTKAHFFMATTVISLFCLFVGGTYAYFNISEYLDSSIITIARLKYQLTSTNTNFQNNSITVGPGETLELTLDLKSLNPEHTKYALNYSSDSSDVKVYYDEIREQNVLGEIGGLNSIININIAIENNTSTSQIVTFVLKGGYLQNILTSNIEQEFINNFIITFDANGGTTPIENKTVTYKSKYGELPTPTKENYAFLGWFTAKDGGNVVTPASIFLTKNNQTLYAHWQVILVPVVAGLKANPVYITDYNLGNKAEMFTFTHPEAEQTTGWSEDERTDYRYIGESPNNYIKFNDEMWRIIGVFTVENEVGVKEKRIKIIRESSIGDFPWDMKSDGTHYNEWPTSSLATMLNGDYVNSGGSFTYTWYNYRGTTTDSTVRGLNSIAKSQISPIKWYLGGIDSNENTEGLGGPDYFNFERGTTTCLTTDNCYNVTRSTSFVANVGLIYPSDYIYSYANGVDDVCYTNGFNCSSSDIYSNWLSGYFDFTQTITPCSSNDNSIFITLPDIVDDSTYSNTNTHPVVYLRSDIEISSGDGSHSQPYQITDKSSPYLATITSKGTVDDYENSPSLTSACYYIKNYDGKTFSHNGHNNCNITNSSCTNTGSSAFDCSSNLYWHSESGIGTQNGYWKGNIWGARCTVTISCAN